MRPHPRRLAAVLLIALLPVAAAACGGSGDAGSTAVRSAAEGAAPVAAPTEISPQRAAEMLADGAATMVDVREPDEYAAQRVPGVPLIPLGVLSTRTDEIPRDRHVLVLCRSGRRAEEGAAILRALGYQATPVAGGITAWAEAGLPYEGAPPG